MKELDNLIKIYKTVLSDIFLLDFVLVTFEETQFFTVSAAFAAGHSVRVGGGEVECLGKGGRPSKHNDKLPTPPHPQLQPHLS